MDINFVNLSGTVTTVTDEFILFRQAVSGKMETKFKLFLPKPLRGEIKKMNLQEGDRILIVNGQIYQKNDEWRVKITTPVQLIRLAAIEGYHPGELFLGEESPDQFI